MKTIHFNKKQKRIILIGAVIVAVSVMLYIAMVIAKPIVQTANDPLLFREWIDSFGQFSRLVYIFLVILQVVIAFIPGEPFEIAAGYCFGVLEGTSLSLIGITLGSLIIYLLVNHISKDFIDIFFSQKQIESLSFLKDPEKMEKLIFVLNVLPGTPKDLLAYFVAVVGLKLKTWLRVVFFARIPSVLSSTLVGSGLAEKSYLFSAITYGTTILLSILGIIIYDKIIKKNRQGAENENK